MRQVDTRFDIIRNGAKVGELQPVEAPTIKCDSLAAIKSSLSGEFYPNAVMDWYLDEVKPILIINGVEYPCGIFAPTTRSYNRSEENGLRTISAEFYDRCWRAQSTTSEGIIHISAGTNYITAIKSLLSASGIALVIATPTSEVMRNDREDWRLGTSYLTIINELLDEINYNELYFNGDGYAVLEPEAELLSQNIKRTYDYEKGVINLFRDSKTELDLFNAPNVFIVSCANPDDNSTMTATAENNNPSSPMSIVRRGKRICSFQTVRNIASQQALNDYANLVCQESMLTGEKIMLSTELIPNCGVGEIVGLVHPDGEGLCAETSWSMSFGTGGKMTHNLSKVVTFGG